MLLVFGDTCEDAFAESGEDELVAAERKIPAEVSIHLVLELRCQVTPLTCSHIMSLILNNIRGYFNQHHYFNNMVRVSRVGPSQGVGGGVNPSPKGKKGAGRKRVGAKPLTP